MEEVDLQIKNSVIYFFPSIIGNILPFITLPIFTRILTKEDYGALALAQVYAVVIAGIANFGLPVGYERNFFENRDQCSAGKLFYSTLAFVIAVFAILTVITFEFKSSLAKFIIGATDYSNLLLVTTCATFFISYKLYFLTYFKNTENAKLFVSFSIAESILATIFSLILVVKFKVGVIGIPYGQLLSSAILLGSLFYFFLKILPFSLDWKILKNSLNISIPLTPRVFFNVLGNQFDKFLIGLLNTTGGVGIYSIGQKISYIVFTSMTALQNVYSPVVYRKMFENKTDSGEVIGKYLTPFAYFSILIALAVALFSQEIIMVLTPRAFHGAIDIIMILSMLYGSYFFGKQPQLIYTKKTFITSLLTLLHILLNLGINIPFIMKWGAIGAAWATFLAGFISTTIALIVSQHYYRIEWEYKKLVHIFCIFYLSTITIILLRHFDSSYMLLVTIKLFAISLYLHCGFWCGILNTNKFLILKNAMSKNT